MACSSHRAPINPSHENYETGVHVKWPPLHGNPPVVVARGPLGQRGWTEIPATRNFESQGNGSIWKRARYPEIRVEKCLVHGIRRMGPGIQPLLFLFAISRPCNYSPSMFCQGEERNNVTVDINDGMGFFVAGEIFRFLEVSDLKRESEFANLENSPCCTQV